MAINKIINVNDGSGREFTENTIAELKFDTKPEVGSFNAVTSDAVARAVAGASGEVPQVTESDNGKILTAIYDEGGAAVEWADVPNEIPEYSGSDEGKMLGVVIEGAEDTPALGWVEPPTELPSYTTSEDGKVLGVVDNSGTAELQWVGKGGTTYVSGSSASVSLSADNQVVTNSVDVTGITVGAGVKSAIVQWVVDSTTTLPTVTDGTNALKASVNNPASLTAGRTVQVSILNGTWVCAEFA